MPLVLLYINKGHLSANRYLSGFFFFASLYLLENFYFFYGESVLMILIFTLVHSFFYVIGPFAFFYMRSILRGNSRLSKTDYLHFALFVISFIGYIPYFYSDWDFKVVVAQNLQSENWDISPFRLNKIFFHEIDQVLNVSHTYFYSISLWYLLWKYRKSASQSIILTKQYKHTRNWLFVFASILTIITINFTIAMAGIWLYDEKSIFLERTSIALLFASLVYIGMNMIILFFPHIMYGLSVDLQVVPTATGENNQSSALIVPHVSNQQHSQTEIVKAEPRLFTSDYKENIETTLETFKKQKAFLDTDFRLTQISTESGIPMHHLTYFFNYILNTSFSDWRNNLRVEYAMNLISQGEANTFTLRAISMKCGFASQSTFIRAFKNVTGTTPSIYLKLFS